MKALRAAIMALALAGCAVAAPGMPPARLALAPAGATVSLRLTPPARRLAAAVRVWRAADVASYDVALEVFDAEADHFVAFPEPRTVSVPGDAAGGPRATFAGLDPAGRYRATVTARGNAGGTAPAMILNAATPAVAEFDLADPEAPREVSLEVALDPMPFSGELVLPSNLTAPGSLPSWVKGLSARLVDPARGAAPIATATWAPTAARSFVNVKGDHPYDLELDWRSDAGARTVRVPGFVVARADGAEQVVAPDFGAPVPPTGTILASHDMPSGAFGVAFDAADHVWCTNQTLGKVSVLGFDGVHVAGSPFALSGQPRAIAYDPLTDAMWIARFTGSKLERYVGGVAAGSFDVSWPSGVAVDAASRVWVANFFAGQVTVLAADGSPAGIGPFTVGAQPAAVAIDRETGDVFVGNTDSNTISRIAGGVVTTIALPAGMKPAGLVVGRDHVLWVVGTNDGKLRRYQPDGTQVGTATTVGFGATAIGMDPATGAMWVGQPNGQRIAKVGPDGVLIGSYPAGAHPNAIAVDRRGHVWVAGGGKLGEHAP